MWTRSNILLYKIFNSYNDRTTCEHVFKKLSRKVWSYLIYEIYQKLSRKLWSLIWTYEGNQTLLKIGSAIKVATGAADKILSAD